MSFTESFNFHPNTDWQTTLLPKLFIEVVKIHDSKRGGKSFQVSVAERAHAQPLIILSAFQIESVARAMYASKHGKKMPWAVDECIEYLSLPPQLKILIAELFIVRDSLAHGHSYKVYYKYDDNYNLIRGETIKRYGGDKKYKTNISRNKTKILKMTVATPRIGYFETINALLILDKFIESTTGHAAWNSLLSDYEGEMKSYRVKNFLEKVINTENSLLMTEFRRIQKRIND